MLALEQGHLQVVQLLIEKGANVNLVNKVSLMTVLLLGIFLMLLL